jgi:hypothetical protein
VPDGYVCRGGVRNPVTSGKTRSLTVAPVFPDADSQLREDPTDVMFGSLGRDVETFADLRVRQSLAQQHQDLPLPGAQCPDLGYRGGAARPRWFAKAAEQRRGSIGMWPAPEPFEHGKRGPRLADCGTALREQIEDPGKLEADRDVDGCRPGAGRHAVRGRFVVHLRVAHVGSAAEGEQVVAPMRSVAAPIMDSLGEMPYTQVDGIHQDPVDPLPVRESCLLLDELTPQAMRCCRSPDQAPIAPC